MELRRCGIGPPKRWQWRPSAGPELTHGNVSCVLVCIHYARCTCTWCSALIYHDIREARYRSRRTVRCINAKFITSVGTSTHRPLCDAVRAVNSPVHAANSNSPSPWLSLVFLAPSQHLPSELNDTCVPLWHTSASPAVDVLIVSVRHLAAHAPWSRQWGSHSWCMYRLWNQHAGGPMNGWLLLFNARPALRVDVLTYPSSIDNVEIPVGPSRSRRPHATRADGEDPFERETSGIRLRKGRSPTECSRDFESRCESGSSSNARLGSLPPKDAARAVAIQQASHAIVARRLAPPKWIRQESRQLLRDRSHLRLGYGDGRAERVRVALQEGVDAGFGPAHHPRVNVAERVIQRPKRVKVPGCYGLCRAAQFEHVHARFAVCEILLHIGLSLEQLGRSAVEQHDAGCEGPVAVLCKRMLG